MGGGGGAKATQTWSSNSRCLPKYSLLYLILAYPQNDDEVSLFSFSLVVSQSSGTLLVVMATAAAVSSLLSRRTGRGKREGKGQSLFSVFDLSSESWHVGDRLVLFLLHPFVVWVDGESVRDSSSCSSLFLSSTYNLEKGKKKEAAKHTHTQLTTVATSNPSARPTVLAHGRLTPVASLHHLMRWL